MDIIELLGEKFSIGGLTVASKSILPRKNIEDDTPQKNVHKRGWLYSLALWAFPVVTYCTVMAVFVSMMRSLTRRHAAEFMHNTRTGAPITQPLEDLLVPAISPDYGTIFDSPEAAISDFLSSLPMYLALFWVIWEGDYAVWAALGGTLSMLFAGKGIATHLTILPEVRGQEYCTWVISRWKERPVDGAFVFCGDMMWSGHSMMMVAGTIVLIHMIHRYKHAYALLKMAWVRRILIALLLLTNMCVMGLLIATKMHYSVDIFIAVIITVLLFSNERLQLCISRLFLVPDSMPTFSC